MKKLLRIIMLMCVCEITYSTYAQDASRQEQLNEFMSKFPQKTWRDLYSIRKLRLKDMNNSDTLPIKLANKLIWYGNVEVRNIRRKDKSIRDYDFLGTFFIAEGWRYDEKEKGYVKSGEFSKLYPLAKIEINDNVAMFVIGYKYLPETIFCFAIDAFFFNKSTQNFNSALCLYDRDGPETILYDDMRISSYEGYENADGEAYMEHFIYRIASDAYLEEAESYIDIAYSSGVVSDTDGYVNVRDKVTTQSKILYTIKDATQVTLFQIPNSNWAEVVWVKDNSGHEGGFVHISRIKDIKKEW